MAKTFTLSVDLEVHQDWIDDGFDLQEREKEIQRFMEEQLLPYAIPGIEVKMKNFKVENHVQN